MSDLLMLDLCGLSHILKESKLNSQSRLRSLEVQFYNRCSLLNLLLMGNFAQTVTELKQKISGKLMYEIINILFPPQ